MADSPIGHARKSESTVAIRVRKVSKTFPGVQALRDVSFELATGEVHGLVGANGAGKSTLIRMLSGASTPDSGDIEVQGSPIFFEDPRAQRKNGIAAIYQELTIIPEMSALSNVFLGAVPHRWLLTDRRRMEKRFGELAAWMGLKISPHAKASTLSVANQQMLEIMRAVQAEQQRHHHGRADRAARPVRALAALRADRAPQGERRLDHLHLARSRRGAAALRPRLGDARRTAHRDAAVIALGQGQPGQVDARRYPDPAGPQARARRRQGSPARRQAFTARQGRRHLVRARRPARCSALPAWSVPAGPEMLRSIAGLEPLAEGRMAIDGQGLPLAAQRPRGDRARHRARAGGSQAPGPRPVALRPFQSHAHRYRPPPRSDRSSRRARGARRRRRSPGSSASIPTGSTPTRSTFPAATSRSSSSASGCTGSRASSSSTSRPAASTSAPSRRSSRPSAASATRAWRSFSVSSDLEEVVEYSDRVLVMARGRQIGLLDGREASVERILNLIFAVENRPATAGAN